MKNRIKPTFAALIVIGSAAIAHADSAAWTGSIDGTWSTVGNWSGPPVAVPSVSGDIATFDGAGNGNTAITSIPALTLSEIRFETASAAAYSFTSSITWSIPADGGVTVTDLVTSNQDLSGIQYCRPTVNTTANFINEAAGTTLKLGTIFSQNAGTGTTNARLRFAPAADAIIEIPSGKLLDNAGSGGVKKMSVLLDNVGTLKIAATGSYNGTDAEGNSVTIRRGTLIPTSVVNASATTKSSLGTGGRIQFGEAAQTYTATLRYENTANSTTDRPFHIIDGNTGVFDITDGLVTMDLTGVITASGTANGGGNLTKKGPGSLTISGGSNSYSGITRIEQGTLKLGNLLAIQSSAYDTSGPGTLDLSLLVGNPTFGGLTSSTAYNLPGDLTLNPPTGRTVTFSGALGESSPLLALTKSGGGTQVLAGDNTFTGNVTVNSGRLTLAHSNALGTGPKTLFLQGTGRTVYLAGGITIPSNITFHASTNSGDGGGINNESGTNEIAGPVVITFGNGVLNISSADGVLALSGGITANTAGRSLILGGASSASNTVSGAISNGATTNLPVTKQGAGKWVFSGPNTYTGDTDVRTGTLVLASGGSQKFHPKSDGTCNKFIDSNDPIAEPSPTTGTLTLDGAFNIELTDAASAPDNTSWLLVAVDNLSETFDTNFTVTGFTESPAGTWKKTEGSNVFTFTESDGRLVKTAAANTYANWLAVNPPATGFTTDSDNDGVSNAVENVLGTNPNTYTAGLTEVSSTSNSITYKHTLNPTMASDLSYIYEWSADLAEWKTSGQTNTGGTSATITPSVPVSGVVTVVTTISGAPSTRLFTRIKVTQP